MDGGNAPTGGPVPSSSWTHVGACGIGGSDQRRFMAAAGIGQFARAGFQRADKDRAEAFEVRVRLDHGIDGGEGFGRGQTDRQGSRKAARAYARPAAPAPGPCPATSPITTATSTSLRPRRPDRNARESPRRTAEWPAGRHKRRHIPATAFAVPAAASGSSGVFVNFACPCLSIITRFGITPGPTQHAGIRRGIRSRCAPSRYRRL